MCKTDQQELKKQPKTAKTRDGNTVKTLPLAAGTKYQLISPILNYIIRQHHQQMRQQDPFPWPAK